MTPEHILRTIYQWPATPPLGGDKVRFELERERRISDITAQLWRFAPLTMAFGRALYQDDFSFQIISEIEQKAHSSTTIYEAAIAALRDVVDEDQESRLSLLLSYDAAAVGQNWATRAPSAREAWKLGQVGVSNARILGRPFRFGDFAKHVEFLVRTHVPDIFLRELPVEASWQCYAYWHQERWRAAEVTALLQEKV